VRLAYLRDSERRLVLLQVWSAGRVVLAQAGRRVVRCLRVPELGAEEAAVPGFHRYIRGVRCPRTR